MKKIILGASLLAASSLSFAGAIAANAPTATVLTPTECAMIAAGQTAKIQLSKDVVANYECTTSAAGFATAHPGGKGKSYRASSNGGKIEERASGTGTGGDFANAAEAATAVATDAATARDAS